MSRTFGVSFEYKVIYVFSINDRAHAGLLKIGDATLDTATPIDALAPNSRELNQAARKRIDSYTQTAATAYRLEHTELAVRTVLDKNGVPQIKAFRDHDVHNVLKNSGIERKVFDDAKGREWFKVDLATAKKAIDAVKSAARILHSLRSQKSIRPLSSVRNRKTQSPARCGFSKPATACSGMPK